MKWYTFNDTEGSMKVNMILDHNSTPLVKFDSVKDALASDISAWDNSLKESARLISANEIAKIVGADIVLNWNELTSDTGFYLDGAYGEDETWQTSVASKDLESKYFWLYDMLYACQFYGCKITEPASFPYYDIEGTDLIRDYWTSSLLSTNQSKAFVIGRNGNLTSKGITAYSGIRPVITIDKSLIS